jgi:hypothetical protein
MINKELFEKIIAKGREVHNMLQFEMDETDTRNWHEEAKYYNADLNALAVIIRFFYGEAESILEESLVEDILDDGWD